MPPLTRKRKSAQVEFATPTITDPSHAVFHVTELLEQILDHLSWRGLFVCQSICRRFQKVIRDSSILRHKSVFFRPGPKTPSSNDLPLQRHRIEKLREWFEEASWPQYGLADGQRVCPLLEISELYDRKGVPFHVDVASGRRWRETGSWRDIHLADPPVKALRACLIWRVKRGQFCSFNGVVRVDDGVTFGKMLDQAVSMSTRDCKIVAFTQRGDVAEEIFDVDDETLAEVIQALEHRLSGEAELVGKRSFVVFDHTAKGWWDYHL